MCAGDFGFAVQNRVNACAQGYFTFRVRISKDARSLAKLSRIQTVAD